MKNPVSITHQMDADTLIRAIGPKLIFAWVRQNKTPEMLLKMENARKHKNDLHPDVLEYLQALGGGDWVEGDLKVHREGGRD